MKKFLLRITTIATICSIFSLAQIHSKKVLTIGSAQQDKFIHNKTNLNSPILAGKKIEINNPNAYTSTGGGAINSAIGFQRLGYNAFTFVKLGNDEQGQSFVQKLNNENINTDNIVFSNDEGTGISFIMPSPNHDNCVLIYRGANKFLTPEEVPKSQIKKSDVIYITSLNGEAGEILPLASQIAKQAQTIVASNPGSTQLKNGAKIFKQALPFIDILLLNETETKLLMSALIESNPDLKKLISQIKSIPETLNVPILLRTTLIHNDLKFTLKNFFKTILELGPKIVVVTNGADGAYIATKNHIYYHPSIPTESVGTTGAGDAFGSCFVATLLKDHKQLETAIEAGAIENAMACGILNSSSVISYMDTNKGLLNAEELEIKFQKIGTNLLQKFDLE
jgi:sugar/nucleoside kinase (ribokinase family)